MLPKVSNWFVFQAADSKEKNLNNKLAHTQVDLLKVYKAKTPKGDQKYEISMGRTQGSE